MEPIERGLRESLAARAEDVEPTPQLWLRVRGRARRRLWVARLVPVVAVTVAVVAAVGVAPLLLDLVRTDRPFVEPAPTGGDPPDTVPVARVPAHLVTTDGSSIVLRDTAGVAASRTLVEVEDLAMIAAVAARPGSAVDDLTVAYLVRTGGANELRYVAAREDDVRSEPFDAPYRVLHADYAGSDPAPVWSPGGSYLAWVEEPERGVFSLRVIGWEGGSPGTGRTADDNTAFEIDAAGLGDFVALRLEEWIWTETSDTGSSGYLVVAVFADDLVDTYRLAVSRQSDGAIASDARLQRAAEPEGYARLDVTYGHAEQGQAGGAVYVLRAAITERTGVGPPQLGELVLDRVVGGAAERLPVPGELRTAPGADHGVDPWSAWISARRDGVLLGDGIAFAWVINAVDGEVERIPGEVRAGSFLDQPVVPVP